MREHVSDEEPDHRFTLANERTFLAWIRPPLALMAGSVVIGDLFASSKAHGRDLALLAICTVSAAVISLSAFSRWRQVQEAMRRNDPCPRQT
jgi:putative membrane protein